MQPYYFKTTGQEPDIDCTEPCQIFKGTMIGSVACQACKFHKKNNMDENGGSSWLICEKINQATGKISTG